MSVRTADEPSDQTVSTILETAYGLYHRAQIINNISNEDEISNNIKMKTLPIASRKNPLEIVFVASFKNPLQM